MFWVGFVVKARSSETNSPSAPIRTPSRVPSSSSPPNPTGSRIFHSSSSSSSVLLLLSPTCTKRYKSYGGGKKGLYAHSFADHWQPGP